MIFPHEPEPSIPRSKGHDDSKKIQALLAGAFAYHYGEHCRVIQSEVDRTFVITQDAMPLGATSKRVLDSPIGMLGIAFSNMPPLRMMFEHAHLFPDFSMMHATATFIAWEMLYLRWALVHCQTSNLYQQEAMLKDFDLFFRKMEEDPLAPTMNVPMVAQHLAQDLIQKVALQLGAGSLPRDHIAIAEHVLGRSDLSRVDFALAGKEIVKKAHGDLAYSPQEAMGDEYWDSLLALVDYGCVLHPPYPWNALPKSGVRVEVDPFQCLSYIDHHK